MSRGAGFVPWWRLGDLARLALDALRSDRPFRWAAAGAAASLALLVARGLDPAPDPGGVEPGAPPADVPPVSATAVVPPPAASGPLPAPGGPSGGAEARGVPIAPGVPLGPGPAAPRDTFGTVPSPRAPIP
ncbi:MAG: hypothetical protein K2X49_01905 [Acetobacteraceae bacterium]|nr:hypothetical protein [Acetobacteraceae bacterium]